MNIAAGKRAYCVDNPPVKAQGLLFTGPELDGALKDRLPALLRDDVGKRKVGDYLAALADTSFDTTLLTAALNRVRAVQDWQVGESLAEAYLVDHKDCEFPWPSGRDLRNPNASPAGADLVGFQKHGNSRRLAFGEVKTSSEPKWPPQVVTSRHGLAKQIEDLRDSTAAKYHLLLYLAHRSPLSSWEGNFKEAAKRYLQDSTDVSLFGFLVRDVDPKPDDLQSRAARLAKGCLKATSVELHAMYLPSKSIETLAKKLQLRKGAAK